MSNDPIVEEVRRAREAEAATYGFDVGAILAAAKARQRRSGRRVVSFMPKMPVRAKPTTVEAAVKPDRFPSPGCAAP